MEKSQIETPQEPISCDDENFHLAIPLGNGVTLEMIKVKAGTFMMGSPEDELGRWHDERSLSEHLPCRWSARLSGHFCLSAAWSAER